MECEYTLKEIFDELGNIHKEYFIVEHLYGKDKNNPLYRRGTLLDRKKLMKISAILGWDFLVKVSDKPIRFEKDLDGELLRKASPIEKILREIVNEGVRIDDEKWWDSLIFTALEQGISDKTKELLKVIGNKSSTAYKVSLYTGLISGILAIYINSSRKNKALKTYQHAYDSLEFLNLVNGAFLCMLGEFLPKEGDGPLFNEHFKQIKKWVDTSKDIPLEKIYSRARGFYYILKFRKDYTVSAANIHLSIFENFDGSGYPTAVSGKDIHEFARIARIAYEFATWLSERKDGEGKRELLAYLLKDSFKDRKGELKNKKLDQDILNIAMNLLK